MTLIISESAVISKLAGIEDSVRGTRIVIADGVPIDSFVCAGSPARVIRYRE